MASKQVISLARVRLASRMGHVVIVEPSKPTSIPEALYVEAAKAGCVDYNPQMFEAFKKALEQAAKQEDSAVPAAEPIDPMGLVKNAVRHVLIAADSAPELLTSQGLPRLPAIRAAFDKLCAEVPTTVDLKITSEMISLIYIEIQDETREQSAGAAESRYPKGANDGDLTEEVGGLDMSQVSEE